MGSGFKDWSPGDVLTAADVDGYLMRQTVMTFADASARDTALSGVLDEGMVAYLEDTNAITVYNGSSWVSVIDSDVLTVDTANNRVGVNDSTPSYTLDVNGDVRLSGDLRTPTLYLDGVRPGQWLTWTPTLYNFTVASYSAFYTTVDDIVFVYFDSSNVTSVTGEIQLSLPFTAQPVSRTIGSMGGTGFAYDVSLADPHWGRPDTSNSGTRIRIWNMITTSISRWNAGSPFTWASGDNLRFTAWYHK